MRRVVVIGGHGFFGRAAIARLEASAITVIAPAHERLDAEDPRSLRALLRRGDVVLDAAGPFHRRGDSLLRAALEVGCDVVDIADDLGYARMALALEGPLRDSGVSLFNCCSSVSVVTAMLVRMAGVGEPRRVSIGLRPAARVTATAATARVMLHQVSHDVRSLGEGILRAEPGWSHWHRFATPAGGLRGGLAESADAVNLPRVYPSLRQVDFWVDAGGPAGIALTMAARVPGAARLAGGALPLALRMVRRFGRIDGALAVEVQGAGGEVRTAMAHGPRSHLVAVIPPALAVRRLAAQEPAGLGLVRHDQQVSDPELRAELARAGITLTVG